VVHRGERVEVLAGKGVVAVRRAYWSAADGSATRKLCELLITKLDF